MTPNELTRGPISSMRQRPNQRAFLVAPNAVLSARCAKLGSWYVPVGFGPEKKSTSTRPTRSPPYSYSTIPRRHRAGLHPRHGYARQAPRPPPWPRPRRRRRPSACRCWRCRRSHRRSDISSRACAGSRGPSRHRSCRSLRRPLAHDAWARRGRGRMATAPRRRAWRPDARHRRLRSAGSAGT